MSQPLQSINLIAPAFKGINTEDSPIAQDPSFAEIADNAVIDKRGRIAARNGNTVLTTTKGDLGTGSIQSIHYFYDDAGNTKLFSAGNNEIFSGTDTLVTETPVAYTINDNNWQMFNFNDAAYFFQRGQEPLVYTNAGGLQTFGAFNGTTTDTKFYCHVACAAYGRVWAANSDTESQTVYWSDLLIGTDFTGGSSGSIDVSKAWPDGYDEIRALAAHNNLLIIFGEHSIIVYQNANSPANMSLLDTVSGVGCTCRNSVQFIGTDVLFVSSSGLKSFGRVIQEKSLPISDLSLNIKTEFLAAETSRTVPTQSVYSPENSFYLLLFPETDTVYCFDLKTKLENGSYRVTRWVSVPFTTFERAKDGTLYTGSLDGIGTYSNYSDNGNSYLFRYYSPALTFGDSAKLKFLKKLRVTLVGANASNVFIKWAYDLSTAYFTQRISVSDQVPYYYSNPLDANGGFISAGGLSEFSDPTELEIGLAEYTTGILTTRKSINASGNGSLVTIGLETDINGHPLSVQEINVLALLGKTL